MAKSVLSTISYIMEVAQPLSQGEQNFKALHGDLTPTNRNVVPGVTDQDFLFKGGERKLDPPTASYENGPDDESKEAYDKTLKVVDDYPEKDKDMKEEVEAVDEATWHQKKSGTSMQHPDKWNVVTDPPGEMKTGNLFNSEKEANDHLEGLKTKNPKMHKHSYILKPKNVTEETEQLDEKEWKMKGQAEYEARYDGKGRKKKPALDPVGKEDSDVNNDGKTDSTDSYLKNRRKVIAKYLKKEEVETVDEAMKGQAEYDARYGAGGKKRPNPEPGYHPPKKKKVKTDWKELLTRKKKVQEEIEDDEYIFYPIKSFTINEHAICIHEDSYGNYLVNDPATEEDHYTDNFDEACDLAKSILRTNVKNSQEYKEYTESVRAEQNKINFEKSVLEAHMNKFKNQKAEYDEDGRGRHKVTYVHPDKKNIESDRFETKQQAHSFAKDLKKKGYHHINIGEESESDKTKDQNKNQIKDTEAEKNLKDTKKTFPNVKHFTKSGHPDWKKHGFDNIPTNEEVDQVEEGAKVDRMEKHIEKSEIAAGKSPETAKKIAWATLNKRGLLNRGK